MNRILLALFCTYLTLPVALRAEGPAADTRPTSPTWSGDSHLHILGHAFETVQPMADHWGTLHVKDELPGALDATTRDSSMDLIVFQDLDDKKLYVSYGRDGFFSNMNWATPGRIGSYRGRRVKIVWTRDEPNNFLEGAYRVLPWIGSVFGESGASQFRGAVATAMGAVLSSGITAFFMARSAQKAGGLAMEAAKPGVLAALWSSLRVPVLAAGVAVAGMVVVGGIASGTMAEVSRRTHSRQRELIISQLIATDGAGTQRAPPAPAQPPTLREGLDRVLPQNAPPARVTSITEPESILDGDDLRVTSRDG